MLPRTVERVTRTLEKTRAKRPVPAGQKAGILMIVRRIHVRPAECGLAGCTGFAELATAEPSERAARSDGTGDGAHQSRRSVLVVRFAIVGVQLRSGYRVFDGVRSRPHCAGYVLGVVVATVHRQSHSWTAAVRPNRKELN